MRARSIGGRRLAAAVVLAATAVGGGAAYAATAGHHNGSAATAPAGASAVAERAPGSPRHFGDLDHAPGGRLSAAASYLGVSASDLRTQLQSGKTLAQIAQATSDKSVDGLVAAMVADAKQQIAAAVSAGRLTQTQADTIESQLTQRITDLVNGTRPSFQPGARPNVPAPGFRGPVHGHDGFGFGRPPSSSGTTTA